MAGIDKQQSNQIVNEAKLPVLRTALREELDDILSKVNQEFAEPLRLFASDPSDALLNIAANIQNSSDGTKRVLLSSNDAVGSFAASTINFQTGSTTGGTILTNGGVFTLPTTSIGEFRRMALVYLVATNSVDTAFSAAAVSVGALADPVTLFATIDGIPLGYIDLEATGATAFKTAASSTAIIENVVSGTTRIFKGAASGSGSGSGSITDFKLQSIGSNIATIKKGSLILDDGRELYLVSDIQFNLKTGVNDDGVIAPANSTQYYLYLDKSFLPSQTSVGNSDRKVYVPASGTSGMFVVLATKPESTDLSRYIPLASLKTNGSGNYTLFDNLALRRHQSPSMNVSPLVQTVGPIAIGSVGSANNYAGGHLKDADSYPASLGASTLSIYSLANANDAIGTRNLTNNGTTPFTGTDIRGSVNAAAALNGSTQSFSSTDVFFNGGDADFTSDIWAAATDWTPAGTQHLVSKSAAAGDRGWDIGVETNGDINFSVPITASTVAQTLISNPGFVDGSWHHFAVKYVASTDTWSFYIDGVKVGEKVQANLVASANIIQLGARYTTAAEFFAGRLSQFGYAKAALSDVAIAKLASSRIDVTASVGASRQIWEADYLSSATGLRGNLDGWMLDKKDTKVYANFGNTAADVIELRLYDGNIGATTIPVRTFNKRYIANPFSGGELLHGLPAMPSSISLMYDEEANGKYRNIAPDVGVYADGTKLYADLSSYTIDATHRLWVTASVGVPSIGFEYPTPDTQSPTGTLTAGQTDISVGPYRVNRYGGQQQGEKLLFIDGILMKRNVSNATASPTADGNYQEVDAGSGIGTVFRMNDTSVLNREYAVVANGLPFFTPSESLDSRLQTLGGQIDAVITSLAEITGRPTTDFQGAPNDTDLAAFGTSVLAKLNRAGVVDGSFPAAGEIGERISGSFAQTSVSTSLADVASSSLPLTAGRWKIRYNVAVLLAAASGNGPDASVRVSLTDNANTVIGNSQRRLFVSSSGIGSQNLGGYLECEEYVSITSSTTYKLRCILTQNGGAGFGQIYASNDSNGYQGEFHATRIA